MCDKNKNYSIIFYGLLLFYNGLQSASGTSRATASAVLKDKVTRHLLTTFTSTNADVNPPASISSIVRAKSMVDKLNSFTDDAVTQDRINTKPGMASVLAELLMRLETFYPILKETIDGIRNKISSMNSVSGMAEKLTKLENDSLNVDDEEKAEKWLDMFVETANGRIEAVKDAALADKLVKLATFTLGTTNAATRIQVAAKAKSINLEDLKTKLSTPPTHEELFARLSEIVSSQMSDTQKAVFCELINFLFLPNGAPAAAIRFKLSKNRTARMVDLCNNVLPQMNATQQKTINDAIKVLSDYKFTNFADFITMIRGQLLFSPNLDTQGLWDKKPVIVNNPKFLTVEALDPKVYYTLADFWLDMQCYNEWLHDISKPEVKMPLRLLCRQIVSSITTHFVNDSAYEAIKTAAVAKEEDLKNL